jgi:hypothetical protein
MFFRRFLALGLILFGGMWLIGGASRARTYDAYDAGYRAGLAAAPGATTPAEGTTAPAPQPNEMARGSHDGRGPSGFFGFFLPLLLIGGGLAWLFSRRRRRGGPWHWGGPRGPHGPRGPKWQHHGAHGDHGDHGKMPHDDTAGARYA